MRDEYIADEFTHRGLTIKIIQDRDAPNPREEYDNVGTMACWHRNYQLGDVQPAEDPDDFLLNLAQAFRPGLNDWLENQLWRRMVKDTSYNGRPDPEQDKQRRAYNKRRHEAIWKTLHRYYVILPLALLDHSGISMYVGSGAHSCDPGGWDSGQIGWIYCTKKKAVEEWGGKSKRYTKKVAAAAEKYLRGEVETYGQYLKGDVYVYMIEDEEGDELGSLGGMFGFDYCRSEAVAEADRQLAELGKQAMESAGDLPLHR